MKSIIKKDKMNSQSIKETGRLEAFSDGVFAIVITLLALELRVPDDAKPSLLKDILLDQWPTYISFFISFFTILILWINHHNIFKIIHIVNNKFIYLNGILLCLVTIVPFTTSLVAGYYLTEAKELVVAIYCFQFLIINVVFNCLWFVVKKHIDKSYLKSNAIVIRKLSISYLMGLPAYLAAVIIAFIMPEISIAICSLLWFFWAWVAYKISL